MDINNIEDDIFICDNENTFIKTSEEEIIISNKDAEIPLIITEIIDISNNVFKFLGKGFNECIYHKGILVDLYKTKYLIESKKIIGIDYKGVNVGYVESDILVYDKENKLIIVVELKAQEKSLNLKEKMQVMKYIRHIEKGNNRCIGLVINFSQKYDNIENVEYNIY